MAQILAFDRAARANDDLTPEQVLRRCRVAAIVNGCNHANRLVVEAAGKKMLAAGVKPHEVVTQAASIAKQLAKPVDQVPA